MPVEFRRSTPADLADMLAIVEAGKAFLRQQGVDQWQRGDPSEAGLLQDITAGESWVLCQEGRVMGTLALVFRPDPSYAVIQGAWGSSQPYAALHRVGMHPDARGTGLAAQLMEGVVSQCQKQGFGYLRVDTHAQNLPMQRFLLKSGFTARGDLTLVEGAEAGCPRIGFDRIL